MAAAKTRLITLLPGADVDLARWLLSLWGIPYREEPHAPVLHAIALRREGAGPKDSPLLLHAGQHLPGVDRIVAALDADAPSGLRLLPDPAAEPALHAEVTRLQHAFRWTMGMGTVSWAYHHLLQDRALIWDSFTTGVPAWEKAALRLGGFGVVRRKLTQILKLDDAAAATGLQAVSAAWDEVDAMLADGRAYLCGGRLTLADLAFATSGAPMVLHPGYGGHLPDVKACPQTIRETVFALRARPAGQFIARLYSDHRAP